MHIFKSLPTVVALSLSVVLSQGVQAVNNNMQTTDLPKSLQNIPLTAISQFELNQIQGSASNLSNSFGLLAEAQGTNTEVQLRLPLAEGSYNVQINSSIKHDNGDVTISGVLMLQGKPHQVLLTQGKAGAIGEIVGISGHRWLLQQHNQVYLVNLDQAGLTEPLYENDVVMPTAQMMSVNSTPANPITMQQHADRAYTIVDIMMLYASEVAEQYPDGLADTLMNQLVAKANQSFVNSGIDMQLRLVHRQFVNYSQPSNFTALEDLRFALDGINTTPTVSSLSNIAILREQYGADIVAMIRVHELNERRICGVASFPQAVPDVVINISNVGISGGSNCADTFIHEIGHNFGAGHQFQNGQSVGALPFAGALLVPGKFNTLMSSIGTGDINRNFKIDRFSNPHLNCAAVVCGDAEQADNAEAINYFAAYNSGLRSAVSNTLSTPPPPTDPDSDGDGITDLFDAFPFDTAEVVDTDSDGVGDNTDVFPNDPAESADFDNDAIGDNADPDDDNDGVSDITDALPFDPTESVDSDMDGIGDNSDQLPFNFQDFNDTDDDNVGNRFDDDNDNDGVDDFDRRAGGKQQLIVVSAGNAKIMSFNLPNGDGAETLYQGPAGGMSFRSDIVDLGAGQLAFIQFSDVLRLDRHSKLVDTLINRSTLRSNFAAHLLQTGDSQTDRRLYVSNGLGSSNIDVFQFGNTATTSVKLIESDNVYRDTITLSTSHNLLAQRDGNQLLSYPVAGTSPQMAVWAQGTGLDKPEHLARLADGSILVTNAGSRNVTRFTASGQYSGVFIAAGSGGLSMPGCIAVDNSGDVYLYSSDTHQILKFSGNNGAPIGIVASAENGGLNEPVAVAVVGAPLDLSPFDPNNDTDGDSVANILDSFPLDATRSEPPVEPLPAQPESSGGGIFYLLPALFLLIWRRIRSEV